MEMAESLPGAAVRRVREETGCEVEVIGLVGRRKDRPTTATVPASRFGPIATARPRAMTAPAVTVWRASRGVC